MNENLKDKLESIYTNLMALVDTVHRQIAELQAGTGNDDVLQKTFAERQNRVAAIVEAWSGVAERLQHEPRTEELEGWMQKIQIGVRLFSELNERLMEELNHEAQRTMEKLADRQQKVKGITRYADTAQMTDLATHYLRTNPSRWWDHRT
ncbi:hypothetical protein GCM10010885_20780 [Alicyclobacillus cellulosilyticus]|uniref:Uncharacterized protein n=1 Tax=Alicyclobacillus cellulosilyticus TaxID=1003997 RepID=A0A917KEL2_9BACL|nr:hypothetical protein [Alicyclobacillus cellulosilyticus]GGJ11335.1 hypothetical protein GCM10010885_20780 [Alicyclobacillus cellulosilyticus]